MSSIRISNQGYSRLSALAQPFSNISASEGKIANLDVKNLSTEESSTVIATNGNAPQAVVLKKEWLICYAQQPGFATLGFNNSLTLSNTPGITLTGANDTRAVTLPQGAIITRVIADDNGTPIGVGSPAIEIINEGFNNYALGAPNFIALAPRDISLYGPYELGGNSAITGATNNFLNVQVVAIGNINGGDLRLTVEYETITYV